MTWTTTKPTEPGAYWLRGFSIGDIGDDPRKALVEVEYDEDGILCCNLHETNSERDMRRWYGMADLDERFEWLGPLEPNATPQPTGEPGTTGDENDERSY